MRVEIGFVAPRISDSLADPSSHRCFLESDSHLFLIHASFGPGGLEPLAGTRGPLAGTMRPEVNKMFRLASLRRCELGFPSRRDTDFIFDERRG